MITLRKVQDQIVQYTGQWQCAHYKQGLSCSTIVWAQRMLVSVVARKHWSAHEIGIDMSCAFDTIRRSTILSLLQDAGCAEDDVRLVRHLLS